MAAADRSVGPAAIVAALALHLGLFAAFTLTVKPKIMPMGDAVPITIVADAPPTVSEVARLAERLCNFDKPRMPRRRTST